MLQQLEAILASPPEGDDLVVQLFIMGGGQLAEIHRDKGKLLMELYLAPDKSITVECEQLLRAIQSAEARL
jgi:hypothetical protein